ncbi:glycosyl transferase [Nitrospira sp. KM1]|uniref:glycosyltransferase family 2 protein n=1 Tax=Nitrospira sp. KM1 TaxID=1936990 RepID=UPI0013A7B33D|nr:glycosyltransferase [Nitrospira sp. KM1]BCA54241.1 glycosyl transferase [Nitrospira sp. KM1]
MLSIIVAIHNQLGHNRLFLDGITRYTSGPYEVIVIDNHSTDGSAEFFESSGCKVIRNDKNLCYPESMNLGSVAARGKYLCHINNDLYVAPGWDQLLLGAMERERLDAASPLGLEMMPTRALTDWMQGRWAAIGQGRLSTGKSKETLHTMVRAMYGDWEEFCNEVRQSFTGMCFDGIVGSCVVIRRDTYEKIGRLDERIQAADWDLYYTLRKRELTHGDVRRCMVVGGVFVHHFIRATVKSKREPFACAHERWTIDRKWDREEQAKLWCKPDELSGRPSFMRSIGERVAKPVRKLIQELDRMTAARRLWVPASRIVDVYRQKFQTLGRPGRAASPAQ